MGPWSSASFPSLTSFTPQWERDKFSCSEEEEEDLPTRFVWGVIATSAGPHCPFAVPLLGFASSRQNATECLKQARPALPSESLRVQTHYRGCVLQLTLKSLRSCNSSAHCTVKNIWGIKIFLGFHLNTHHLYCIKRNVRFLSHLLPPDPQILWWKNYNNYNYNLIIL